jgi:FkbM family methyltransferase
VAVDTVSRTLSTVLTGLVRSATAFLKPYRRVSTQAQVAQMLAPVVKVEAKGRELVFTVPSQRAAYEPMHLQENEPETIRWLDSLPRDEVLWDIGANNGLYTIYAAAALGLRVLAFEPSASSYAVLTRNIELNRLDEKVDAYCLAFDDHSHLEHLRMASTEAGHSMHAFGQDHSVQGRIDTIFRQAVPGFSIADFCRMFSPPLPDHIKLDVDSIELEILQGAAEILRTHVKTVMVEVESDQIGAGIRRFLSGLGFAEDSGHAAGLSRTRNCLFRRGS